MKIKAAHENCREDQKCLKGQEISKIAKVSQAQIIDQIHETHCDLTPTEFMCKQQDN
jgi:hypothetical protein